MKLLSLGIFIDLPCSFDYKHRKFRDTVGVYSSRQDRAFSNLKISTKGPTDTEMRIYKMLTRKTFSEITGAQLPHIAQEPKVMDCAAQTTMTKPGKLPIEVKRTS